MKRGDLIIVREPNSPASKARPYVVLTRDSALASSGKVTGCPLTSHLTGVVGGRPLIAPTPENGLRTPSEVQVDWVYTHPIDRIDGVIGTLDKTSLNAVDVALRRWLSL